MGGNKRRSTSKTTNLSAKIAIILLLLKILIDNREQVVKMYWFGNKIITPRI